MEGGKGSLLGWAELPVTEIENSEKVSYSFHFLWHYFLKWHCSVLTDWSRGRLWGWRGSWRSAVDPEQKFPLRLGFFISNHLASASWAQIRPSKYGYREGGCQQTVPKGDYSGTPKPQARPAKNRWYTLYLMIFQTLGRKLIQRMIGNKKKHRVRQTKTGEKSEGRQWTCSKLAII